MRPNIKFIILLVFSVSCGLKIAWIDNSPGWDDTGITAGMIVLTAALFGFLYPKRPWIWALTVSGWIPLFAIVKTWDFKMLMVFLFGFAGAYLGSSIKNNLHANPE
jgi:hypothetical protein